MYPLELEEEDKYPDSSCPPAFGPISNMVGRASNRGEEHWAWAKTVQMPGKPSRKKRRMAFTEEQVAAMDRDRKTMTFKEVMAKWGCSSGFLTRHCPQSKRPRKCAKK